MFLWMIKEIYSSGKTAAKGNERKWRLKFLGRITGFPLIWVMLICVFYVVFETLSDEEKEEFMEQGIASVIVMLNVMSLCGNVFCLMPLCYW